MIFVFLYAAVMLVLLVYVQYLFANTISNRVLSEYESIVLMANSVRDGNGNETEVMDIENRPYILLDQDGKVIRQRGINTCSLEKVVFSYGSDKNKNIEIYLDNNSIWMQRDDDGSVQPNYNHMLDEALHVRKKSQKEREDEILKIASRYGISEETDEDEVEDAVIDDEAYRQIQNIVYGNADQKVVVHYLWIPVRLSNGETFVGQASVYVTERQVTAGKYAVAAAWSLAVIALILVIIMVTRNVIHQRKILNIFLTDHITSGHNWFWMLFRLEPRLQSLFYRSRSFAVIEIVFVNYRNFCTCHSIAEGEAMIQAIDKVIRKKLHKREYCAHVAASSFAVVMECADVQTLRIRLRDLIGELENVDGTHKFSFHIGVKISEAKKKPNGRYESRRNFNIEWEYNNACMARSSVANSDDSRIAIFDTGLVEEQKWIDTVREKQKKAIENEEFAVYYQPKYDPRNGKLRGAEALIRWNSPELGFISPGKFIPIFEKNGFITEIDHYMITHVARDQKAWLDQGLNCVPVSVNVSRAHFIESNLAEQIRDMVDAAGAPRGLIEIELTESAFFDDKNAMIETIRRLKEYGFVVSMDDFGAGYSSLNSLKDMPLDVLKLDAEFFRGQKEGGRGEIVVSEAIKLAKNLNMHTVAEGVEDKEQVEFLAKQGCDMIQGFYFAKPMPKEDFLERIKSGVSEKADAAEKESVVSLDKQQLGQDGDSVSSEEPAAEEPSWEANAEELVAKEPSPEANTEEPAEAPASEETQQVEVAKNEIVREGFAEVESSLEANAEEPAAKEPSPEVNVEEPAEAPASEETKQGETAKKETAQEVADDQHID